MFVRGRNLWSLGTRRSEGGMQGRGAPFGMVRGYAREARGLRSGRAGGWVAVRRVRRDEVPCGDANPVGCVPDRKNVAQQIALHGLYSVMRRARTCLSTQVLTLSDRTLRLGPPDCKWCELYTQGECRVRAASLFLLGAGCVRVLVMISSRTFR